MRNHKQGTATREKILEALKAIGPSDSGQIAKSVQISRSQANRAIDILINSKSLFIYEFRPHKFRRILPVYYIEPKAGVKYHFINFKF